MIYSCFFSSKNLPLHLKEFQFYAEFKSKLSVEAVGKASCSFMWVLVLLTSVSSSHNKMQGPGWRMCRCPFSGLSVLKRESDTCATSLLFTWPFVATTSTTGLALKVPNQLVYSRFGTCLSYFSHQCQPDTNQNHLGKRSFIWGIVSIRLPYGHICEAFLEG